MSDDAGTEPSDDNAEGSSSSDEINLFAGIDAYQAARDAAKRTADYASSPQFQVDAMEAARNAIARLRDQAAGLDSVALAQVKKAARANEDWLEAERKKIRAAAIGAAAQPKPDDADAGERVAESIIEQEKDQDRIEETLLLMQGILIESKAAAESLRQIRRAHDLAEQRQNLADKRQALADKRQREQEKTNNWVRDLGLLVAVAALVTSFGMPMWQHYVWDAEKEKKAASNTEAPQTPAVEPPTTSAVESPASPGTGQECNPAQPPARYLSCLLPIQTRP